VPATVEGGLLAVNLLHHDTVRAGVLVGADPLPLRLGEVLELAVVGRVVLGDPLGQLHPRGAGLLRLPVSVLALHRLVEQVGEGQIQRGDDVAVVAVRVAADQGLLIGRVVRHVQRPLLVVVHRAQRQEVVAAQRRRLETAGVEGVPDAIDRAAPVVRKAHSAPPRSSRRHGATSCRRVRPRTCQPSPARRRRRTTRI
jgi:hypothetical protein